MGRINVLDEHTANAIKAGEVIERPVSVVKELFDNSADAGATVVKIEFASGGIEMIRVSDNGIGMDREDAQKAFLIHATSKITCIEDIYDLSTQGFRGEALASIAACSDVTLVTRQEDSNVGTKIVYEDGKLVYNGDGACDQGTVVEVRSLFKNIPARYKFLKKDSTEGMYICQLVEKLAMINPHISVKLIKDGKMILSTPGNGDLLDTIYSIYGKDTAAALKAVDYRFENYRITGFAGKPSFVRGNRSMQCVFVNDRPVKNLTVTAAIDEAYKNAVMKGKFPVCFLMIYCPPGTVDVNVHPQKAEVRFNNESDIFRLVYHGITNVLFAGEKATEGFERPAAPDIKHEPISARPAAVKAPAQTVSETSHKLREKDDSEGINAANRLLELLSAYKPDVSSIEGENEAPTQTPIAEPIVEEQVKEDRSEIEELINGDYKGTLFSTYIIMQTDDSVYFIDQHAAHERVLYERFMNKKLKGISEDNVERLLVPQIMKLSSADYSFITDNVSSFLKNGYEIEILDDREIALRTIPLMKGRAVASKMFEQVLTDLKHDTPDKNDIWYHLIQTTACKAAVKAGDYLSYEEIKILLKEMSDLKDPYHCAHGRPTFFKVTRTEFEKRFKRIV